VARITGQREVLVARHLTMMAIGLASVMTVRGAGKDLKHGRIRVAGGTRIAGMASGGDGERVIEDGLRP